METKTSIQKLFIFCFVYVQKKNSKKNATQKQLYQQMQAILFFKFKLKVHQVLNNFFSLLEILRWKIFCTIFQRQTMYKSVKFTSSKKIINIKQTPHMNRIIMRALRAGEIKRCVEKVFVWRAIVSVCSKILHPELPHRMLHTQFSTIETVRNGFVFECAACVVLFRLPVSLFIRFIQFKIYS